MKYVVCVSFRGLQPTGQRGFCVGGFLWACMASELLAQCLIHKGGAVVLRPRYLLAAALHGSVLTQLPRACSELESACMNGLVKGLSFINGLHCLIYHVVWNMVFFPPWSWLTHAKSTVW